MGRCHFTIEFRHGILRVLYDTSVIIKSKMYYSQRAHDVCTTLHQRRRNYMALDQCLCTVIYIMKICLFKYTENYTTKNGKIFR